MKIRALILTAALLGALGATTLVLSQAPEKSDVATKYSGKPCAEHGIADSLCTRCHPALIPLFKERGDWCSEHKLPESQCYLCHPELQKASGMKDTHDHNLQSESETNLMIDWCAEHRVPESECTKCHPELVAKFKEKGDWCGGHGVPESHCYLCNPDLKFPQEQQYQQELETQKKEKKEESAKPRTSLFRSNAPHCTTDDAIIQLASVETAERAGLMILAVDEIPLTEVIEAPAEVEFDATASYAVTSLVSGTLTRWLVSPGEHVRQGQILAYLESIEGAALKAECEHAAAVLALAKKEYERTQELGQKNLVSSRELQQAQTEHLRAEADYRKAASALKALGYSENDLDRLSDDDAVSLPIRARHTGTLVEQRVELGAIIQSGESIGLISETGRLWVEARVRERELPRVRVGQMVTLSSDGDALGRCRGIVTWVADGVDPSTRMGLVRIEAEPNGSSLRAHQFVRVQIATDTLSNAVMVPLDAVQWEGCCNVVFVSETRDRFRPRKVQVEFSDGKHYAVSGLNAGERVVTRGSYLLKTELMKGSLGAGCAGEGA